MLDTSVALHLLLQRVTDGRTVRVAVTVSTDTENNTALTSLTSEASTSHDPFTNVLHALRGAAWTSAPPLTVLSLNLWNFKHFDLRRPLLLDLLTRLRPVVVLWQEVRARKWVEGKPSADGRWQVEALAAMLPDHEYRYAPVMGFRESTAGEHHDEGLAVFSMYPIVDTRLLLLSRRPDVDAEDFHQRAVLHARVVSPLGPVHVLTTHFSLSATARQRNVPEVLQHIQRHCHGEPVVLTGDLNAEWDSSIDGLVSGHGGLQDAWRLFKERRGEDAAAEDGWTFKSWPWERTGRIDYVLVRGLHVDEMRVEGTDSVPHPGLEPIAGVNDTRGVLYPSDHLFLFAQLSLDKGGGRCAVSARRAVTAARPEVAGQCAVCVVWSSPLI